MRALTVSQPYADLIASGEKWIENRNRRMEPCGPLAIHAGKGTQYMTREEMNAKRLPAGFVVAIADFVACVSKADLDAWAPGGGVVIWSDASGAVTSGMMNRHEHTEGPYCLVLLNARRLPEPIPCRGQLGLWLLPANIEQQILELGL